MSKRKIITLSVIATLAIILMIYLFAFKLKPAKKFEPNDLISFEEEGFIDAKLLSNTNKLVAYNSSFELYLDETTSYFSVLDKATGEVIRSNPNVRDPRQPLGINVDLDWLTPRVIEESYRHTQYQLNLPEEGPNGSVITYESSDLTVIDSTFKVIPNSEEEKTVTLTANFNTPLHTATATYNVKVGIFGAIKVSNLEKTPAYQEQRGMITKEAIDKQKSTLELSYYSSTGSVSLINNYNLSIYHPATIIAEEGNRTYKIKYLEDKPGFQVYYEIADQEIDHLYFPRYMDNETREYIKSKKPLLIMYLDEIQGYDYSKELYYIKNYETMTLLIKEILYEIYYEILDDYSRERAIEENAANGYFEGSNLPNFKVAVEVVLTETGFKTSIIKESIQEPEDIKIASISLYPFLGTAISVHEDYSPTTGYMVVPDGSGAVIEFNNNKLSQSGYRKRIYASDISNQRIKMPEEQEMISIPVYGMIKENIGLASIVTNGASMTFINADISEKIDSYNKIFPTIQYRENYLHTLGTGWNTYSVSLWSKGMANTDLTVEHVILRGANNNYVGIAKAYQNYLVKEEGLTKQDSPNKPKTTLELLGAYDVKAYALGVPYNKVKSLTTFKEARKITDEFSNENYDINVLFDGALNGGLRSGIQTKASFERTLGGKRGYKSLDKYLREKDIDMYLQLNVTGARSFRRAFDEYTYTAQRLNGDLTRDFQYHLPSQLPYSEAGAVGARHSADDYVLSSRYYEPIYNKIKKKIPTDNISFTKLGSNLIGSYRHSDTIYVEDTLEYTKALLQNSEKNMMLKNPLGFTFPYTKYAVDIAMDTTLFPIIDYAIPLVHLVLADYVPYASRSLNLLTQRGERFNFLKVLETGSQLKYTLSYGDPKELINTEYTKYLSTYYMYWVETIKEQMDELNNLGIYEGYLISHKKVANNVYVVNYSNGLELYINYNTNPVVVNGKNVDALSYVKGGV